MRRQSAAEAARAAQAGFANVSNSPRPFLTISEAAGGAS